MSVQQCLWWATSKVDRRTQRFSWGWNKHSLCGNDWGLLLVMLSMETFSQLTYWGNTIQHLTPFRIVMQFMSYPLEMHTLQPNKTPIIFILLVLSGSQVGHACCRWSTLIPPSYSWFSSPGEKSCKLVRAVSHFHPLSMSDYSVHRNKCICNHQLEVWRKHPRLSSSLNVQKDKIRWRFHQLANNGTK